MIMAPYPRIVAYSTFPFRPAKSVFEKIGKAQDSDVVLAPCLLTLQVRPAMRSTIRILYDYMGFRL